MVNVSKILVPVDFSPYSENALAYAVDLAKKLGAAIDVLHVFEVPVYFLPDLLVIPTRGGNALPVRDAIYLEAKEKLDELLARFASRDLAPHSVELVSGAPATTIVKYAAEHHSDLIVMGTRGRTGAARMLLGSVAQRVVEHAPCPVLTIRAT
jgi:universal stress protein A